MSLKINDLIKQILEEKDYKDLISWPEQNLYESYALLGELLNPSNAYLYEGQKGFYRYKDAMDNSFFARIVYQPTSNPYYEFKTGWLDEKGKAHYDLPDNITGQDWDKRSDTVAKIYKDEIIPLFLDQNLSNKMIIAPLDMKRYQFAIRLVKKFTPKNIQIIENKPKDITLIKKDVS